MKKIVSIIAITLSLILILPSCAIDNNTKNIEKISNFINEKKYNECRAFIEIMKDEDIDEINTQISEIIINEFKKISENKVTDKNLLFDISVFDKNFINSCRELGKIAELIKIDSSAENYSDFILLEYFSYMSNMLRYQEIYSLMKSVNESGYLEKLNTAIADYKSSGIHNEFEEIKSKAENFDYGAFDPQQHMVSDFRNSHDSIVKNLNSLCNGLLTNDISLTASAMNSLYDDMEEMLYITDTVKYVNSRLKSVYSSLTGGAAINTVFDSEIKVLRRDYTPNLDFALNSIFGRISELPDTDESVETTDSADNSFSKEEAVEIAVNAVNKTKNYRNRVTVELTQKQNIKMTSFNTGANVSAASEIAKSQINDALKRANANAVSEKTFLNGMSGSQNLNDFIPPYGAIAALDASSVTSYSVTKGSGGYIISLALQSETGSNSQPDIQLRKIVNPFIFDGADTLKSYETYYAPSKIDITVSGDGMLIKFRYSINGVSKCRFNSENGGENSAEFSFDNNFIYQFTY